MGGSGCPAGEACACARLHSSPACIPAVILSCGQASRSAPPNHHHPTPTPPQINPRDPVLSRHLRPVLEGVHSALQAAAARVSGADASACRLAMHVIHSQLTM